MNPPALAIRAERLTKRYGSATAVDGVDLVIPSGRFFGLLGPNGAGKTSTIHMLSTLIRPTSGEAWVAGCDVRAHSLAVRRRIGVVFQDAALDRALTAAENLRFAGLLNNLSRAEIRRRSAALLELFGLTERSDVPVGALSGGMRRALASAESPRRVPLGEPPCPFAQEGSVT
jgi:ABC-2 type transport system ATP-binding protein